jgi:tetratricopeptide (TPR) repeat protein
MDRQRLLAGFKAMFSDRKRVLRWGGGLVAILVVATTVGFWKGRGTGHAPAPEPVEASRHEAASPAVAVAPEQPGLGHALAAAPLALWEKVAALGRAEHENERLRLENANLRSRLEAVQFDCRSRDTARATRDESVRLSKDTGSLVGRTLETIHYRPPTHLLPPQLYTLGVSYFKAQEDEKAAVILTYLTGLEENDAFKTARNYLMTGVAWYRVDNFALADTYFDKVLAQPETPENRAYMAQARLWRGMAAKRMNKTADSQKWLRELLDHHPHSMEAAWINRPGAWKAQPEARPAEPERELASPSKEQDHEHAPH